MLNKRKDFVLGMKSEKIWAFIGVLIDPQYALCIEHNKLHPDDIDIMTEYIFDLKHVDLNIRLRKVLSNSRHSLCDYYEQSISR